jgi:anti-anti-sigma regulatory factor/anti-sigma regulatory factor (Ser/Thr protein kinase)
MPSQLVCRPEQDLPVAVLKVAGVLDGVTRAALHSAVLECLAAQPEAVLIDAKELRIDDPCALAVLAEVADETAEWPGVPIVLCGADAATTRQVEQSPARHAVSLADDCGTALAQTGSVTPRRLRLRLRPVPDACRKARQLVTQACTAWHLGELVSAGALIATELVANVVRHAHTGMELTVLLRDGRVLLAVRDGSTRLPRPADPGLNDPGGRGLRLVRELADSWGVLPLSSGKVVWTTLSAPGTATVAA